MDLDELERLLAAATPRPWTFSGRDIDWRNDPSISERSGLGYEIEGPPEPQLRGQFEKHADAALIVAAVNALPALIAVARAWYQAHPEGVPISQVPPRIGPRPRTVA